MQTISGATSDGYTAAMEFAPDPETVQIVFDAGNNPVTVQYYRFVMGGVHAELDPTEETFSASLGNVAQNVAGMRFRSAVAGSAVQLKARRHTKADVQLTPGTPYDGTVSAGGGLTPPVGLGTLNMNHNGVLVGTENTIDLVDAVAAQLGVPGLTWTAVDTPGTKVAYTPVLTRPTSPVLAYVQFTAPVTITNGTAEATAVSVVSAGAVTFDGVTQALIQFWCPSVTSDSADPVQFVLYDGASSIGLASGPFPAISGTPPNIWRRLIPTAASHTYSIRAFNTGAASKTVNAGAGGVGALLPGFIRIVYDI